MKHIKGTFIKSIKSSDKNKKIATKINDHKQTFAIFEMFSNAMCYSYYVHIIEQKTECGSF